MSAGPSIHFHPAFIPFVWDGRSAPKRLENKAFLCIYYNIYTLYPSILTIHLSFPFPRFLPFAFPP